MLLQKEPEQQCWVAKLTDFGLSRLLTRPELVTQTYGTVTHAAPELLMHGKLTKVTHVRFSPQAAPGSLVRVYPTWAETRPEG